MKRNKKPFLSVIIPVFNEEKRIHKLKDIISYLKKQKYSSEIVVINDGSTDKTGAILKKYKRKINLISYFPNRGKGAAIKTGMLESLGKYRLFLDVDLSTPISEFEKFFPHLNKYDIIIGSRKIKDSNLITRQSLLREYLGKIFTSLSIFILNLNTSDLTCGFKSFSGKTAEEIFQNQTIPGWGFDPEILYIAQTKKKTILEIPVTWKNDPRTKVKFPRDIIFSLWELIKIRINAFEGRYT
jgi:dolichyl-phosphate beta-glucosyltransferase